MLYILAKLAAIQLYDLKIENFVFVTDRGRNFIAALKDLNRHNCSAHIINNILNSAANESSD